ncbi:hypothetical protein J2X67_005389 [Variovorax sp. 3319]|nr:hypothetical protein [Variovorax sp. 3319]
MPINERCNSRLHFAHCKQRSLRISFSARTSDDTSAFDGIAPRISSARDASQAGISQGRWSTHSFAGSPPNHRQR